VAVVLAIAYLLLVIRENIWCWVCAGISSAIYVWLFIVARLYMESLLYAFYVGMAVYGWVVWKRGGEDDAGMPISVWSLNIHILAAVIILALATATGWFLSKYTHAAFPYVDSMTTFAAIWATFLVARKVLENWWYWLVIDIVSIAIYWARGLELTAVLFVIYVILIPVGLLQWWRTYRLQAVSGQ
jgi:nicotinamide mononucleotide transporter